MTTALAVIFLLKTSIAGVFKLKNAKENQRVIEQEFQTRTSKIFDIRSCKFFCFPSFSSKNFFEDQRYESDYFAHFVSANHSFFNVTVQSFFYNFKTFFW